MEVCIVEKFIM